MMKHPYEAPPPLPAENGVHVWRAAVVVPIITFFFVAARFYTRFYILRRRATIDDYIVAATMVVSIVHAVLIANATYHGMGLHIWQFTPELNAEYYLWLGISSEFYNLGLAGFKSALVLLYLQTFGLVSRRFRLACYLTLFYTLGYLTANLFTEFLGCWPIAKKWQPDLPGSCINRVAANTFFGIGHVTSDLIIAILPLPSVWRLTFPSTKQKIGLSLTLSSGFLAWTVATIRYVISTYNQFTYDRTWWAGISFTFSILELNTGLICACVPTYSPLLSTFWSWSSSYTVRRRVPDFITNTWRGSRTRRGTGEWQNSGGQKRSWDETYGEYGANDDINNINNINNTYNYNSTITTTTTTTTTTSSGGGVEDYHEYLPNAPRRIWTRDGGNGGGATGLSPPPPPPPPVLVPVGNVGYGYGYGYGNRIQDEESFVGGNAVVVVPTDGGVVVLPAPASAPVPAPLRREMTATFSPVDTNGDEMPLCDLAGLQALAERGLN